ITGGTDSTSYCIGDTAEINVGVALSSASYLPVAADSLSALIKKGTDSGIPVEMTYDTAKGEYSAQFKITETGNYTIIFTGVKDGITGTLETAFSVTDDFGVILNNADAVSYSMGQVIPVSGAVRTPEGVGYSGVPVTITAVGSDTFNFNAITGADGSFSTEIQLPDGVGGAFALRASATYSGVLRRSGRVAFYVDGISIDVDDRMTIVQGYDKDLIGYINNLGVTGVSVDNITVSNLPAGLTYDVVDAPAGTLDASSGSALVIRFTASAELTPGEYKVTVSAGESTREVTVTCERAIAVARVNVIGNTEAENNSLETPNITMSLRQGETVSSVIRLTNIGTAPITGVTASTDIPFIYLQNVDPEAVIMPVNLGYSIRDPKGSLSITVNASPSDYCMTGVYEGAVTINSTSLANPIVVPIKISVGAGQVGTTVFEVRNQDNTLLSGAKVTLIGLDEQLDPVRFDAVTGDGTKAPLGEVTFENIPAGSYNLKVTADSHSTLETVVEIAAVIDRTPRIVTLSRQLFSFSVDEETIKEMRSSSAGTANYSNIVFKAGLLADSGEPQLAPNFMADEKEFFYQSGKLLSKISFMDPKDSGAAIDNVTVRIVDADSSIPEGAIAFSGGETLSPIKKMGRIAPGDVFDVVWNLDVDSFFRIATVSVTETEGQYSVQFPNDVTREMIDAYIAANDPAYTGALKELSFDTQTNTGIYQANSTLSDRVPVFYGNKPYSFDFAILASGVRTDTDEMVETKIPVRIHYIPPDYYVSAGEPDSLYDDDGNYKGQQYVDIYDVHPDIEQKVKVSPEFEPASGRVSEMKYSTGFLHDIQADTPDIPEDTEDVSIDFGFSSNVGYEGQITTLNMKLKNPSVQHPMENLNVKLVLTDAPYDGGGNLQPGGMVLFPNVNVYVDNKHLHTDGEVVGGTLGTDEEASIEYSFRLDNLLRNFESLSAFDETLAEYLKDTRQLNKVYARIEGSFTLDGKEHSFVTAVREYEVKEQPKLYISYDLKDNDGYALTATITNLGAGDANNISFDAPAIPNVGFDMKITGVTSTRGIVQRGVTAGLDRVEISVLHPGDTAVITYNLAAVKPLTDAQKISLGKLAALPSISIKSDLGAGIVTAPMKMEAMRSQSTLDDIDAIIDELGYLSNNLRLLTDKTASELGRSLADFYDYSNSLQVAISAGECFETLARFVGVISFVKDLHDLPGKVKSVTNHFKNIKFEATKVETLGFLDDWFDGALYELQDHLARDIDWTLDVLPKDIGYWYDTYNDAATRAETLNSKVNMGAAFGEYVRLTKAAAALLADSSTAINNALKTYSTAERADQAKVARVKMEEAAALIKDAKKLKADGNKLFEGIVSGVSNSDGLMIGYTEDQLRLEVSAYVAAAENALEPRITAVAAGLAQLAGLEDFENQVKILQTSSSQIDNILSEDERLANEMTGLVNAANSMFKDIGYDVNASAESRLNALRNGRKELKEKMKALAMRPAVWFSGLFKIVDNSTSKNVQESTPDIVRTVGKVIQKHENGGSDGNVAENILTEFFGGATSAYSWFVRDFESGYPTNGTKAEKRRYIATAVVKLSTRELINETLFNKSLEKLMLSGVSDYRQSVEAARISSSGVKTNVYYTQNSMDETIGKIIGLLNKYKTDPQMLTGYYPSAQLLDYVKNLNSSISAMVKYSNGKPIESGRVGRYRSLWTYSGAGLDLNIKETTLGEIYKAQQLVDTLLAEGYNNVADRYILNCLKVMESSTSIIGTSIGFLSGSPVTAAVGSMVGVAGKLLDSSGYSKAMDTLDNANLYNLSRATADLAITTNLMLSKEANIANDLYSVFDTMEKWRKVDPELPIEIVTADVADLRVSEDTIFDTVTAALTVMNNHTGSVTIAPTVEIYDSFGMVNTVNMGTKTIAPNELGEFVTDIYVPINMLRDMGGYTAVFTFAASEADTMTIAPTFGPYITHFNVGTTQTVDYLRDNALTKQPLGGTLNAGDSKTVTVNVANGNLLYVFAVAKPGEDDLALTVSGAGTKQTSSHINDNDFVLIADASGEYTITVANNGNSDFEYDLLVVVSPDLGAVAGLDIPYAKVMAGEYSYLDGDETVTGVKASIPVSIFETGLTTGMDVSISASVLENGMGQSIPAPAITDLKGYDISTNFRLGAGEGKSMILGYYPTAGTPDGDYDGTVTLTVNAKNFEHELTPVDWVLNGDVYEFTIPVSVRIDTSVPSSETQLYASVTEDGRLEVSGIAKPGSTVAIFLAKDETSDGTIKAMIPVEADGTFSMIIEPDEYGTNYIYARTSGNNGSMG
ncbi:MAG: hypothetical protein IJQ28_04025, partial [Clostridia bacterium]|nr:hypothetical protein [Clostridia bacterium]